MQAALRHENPQADGSGKRQRNAQQACRSSGPLNKGKNVDPADPVLETIHLQYRSACDRREQAREKFEQLSQAALEERSQRIRQVASLPEFRKAMLLQNPKAARVSFAGLQNNEPGGKWSKKVRQREELIARFDWILWPGRVLDSFQ